MKLSSPKNTPGYIFQLTHIFFFFLSSSVQILSPQTRPAHQNRFFLFENHSNLLRILSKFDQTLPTSIQTKPNNLFRNPSVKSLSNQKLPISIFYPIILLLSASRRRRPLYREREVSEFQEHPWLQNAKKAPNVPLGDIVRSRLKQFSTMNRFKKKALRVIAEHLSLEEVEVIRDMFTLMDTDNDGKVSYEELQTGLRKVGSQLAEPEIKMLMEVADVDGNGILVYGEFVAVTIHLQKMENDEHFRRAFMFFDKDGSGYIELEELREGLADESGETENDVLNDIMREVDTDKDGRISYDEFVAMMKAGTDWRKASRQYSRESLLFEG